MKKGKFLIGVIIGLGICFTVYTMANRQSVLAKRIEEEKANSKTWITRTGTYTINELKDKIIEEQEKLIDNEKLLKECTLEKKKTVEEIASMKKYDGNVKYYCPIHQKQHNELYYDEIVKISQSSNDYYINMDIGYSEQDIDEYRNGIKELAKRLK